MTNFEKISHTNDRNIIKVGQEITILSENVRAIIAEIFIEPQNEPEEYYSDNWQAPKALNLMCFSQNCNWQVWIKSKKNHYYHFSEFSTKIDKSLPWEMPYIQKEN